MTAPPKPLGRRKSPDAFRTIGEAAAEIGVEPHVLRFWETKFARLKPLTRAGGRRYYRPADLELLRKIKRLLHDDGMTIRGAQKLMQGRASPDLLDTLSGTDDATDSSADSVDGAQQQPIDTGNAATGIPASARMALAELAAEARSIAKGGAIPPVSATD